MRTGNRIRGSARPGPRQKKNGVPNRKEQPVTPDVSVLLPVYNAAPVIARAVNSIRLQTLDSFELLVVNDGSTDGTSERIDRLAARDERIRPLHRPHRGLIAALNDGLANARAPLIARMDADDVSRPTRLEKQKAFLDERPEIGLAGCRVAYGGDRDSQAGYAAYVDWTNTLLTPGEISLNRFVESPFAHPSVTFRKPLVDEHGPYREGPFPEDYELWLRWLEAGVAMAKLPDPLLVWSDPPGRLSRTHSRYDADAFYRLKAKYLARWLADRNPRHPEVIVWGAGRRTRKRAEHLCTHGIRIAAYVDIDPRKIGQTIHGRPVLSPEAVPPAGSCFVLAYVASRGARDDIRRRLAAQGHVEGEHFLCAA